MNRLRYKGILFDLDGTLLDTTPLILDSFQHTFRTQYGRELSLEDIQPFMGQPLRAAMETMAPGDEEKLMQVYRDYNLSRHDDLAAVFDGVQSTVHTLFQAGVKLAIVTSKTATTARRGLRLFDMEKYFSVVVGLDETAKHKPLPEPVLFALKLLKLTPADCIMVGDSPHDIESAKAAAVATAGVRWSQVNMQSLLASKPDFMLEQMPDLLDVCLEKEVRRA